MDGDVSRFPLDGEAFRDLSSTEGDVSRFRPDGGVFGTSPKPPRNSSKPDTETCSLAGRFPLGYNLEEGS